MGCALAQRLLPSKPATEWRPSRRRSLSPMSLVWFSTELRLKAAPAGKGCRSDRGSPCVACWQGACSVRAPLKALCGGPAPYTCFCRHREGTAQLGSRSAMSLESETARRRRYTHDNLGEPRHIFFSGCARRPSLFPRALPTCASPICLAAPARVPSRFGCEQALLRLILPKPTLTETRSGSARGREFAPQSVGG